MKRLSSYSFDLFNTLVCTKNSDERAGDFPVEDLVPIKENIEQIQLQDCIISDYYDKDKAEYIVRNICKLPNQLIVSENGKATGKVWENMLHIEHHMGDNLPIDVITPRNYGIKTTHTTLWKYYNNEIYRGLQLHQINLNFIFLLKVAYRLNDYILTHQYTRLLLCSRDCYLLYLLMTRWFNNYNIEYFYNNRLMRRYPTPEYLTYAQPLIDDKTIIVDLCGSGETLKLFTDKYGGYPYYIMTLPGIDQYVTCMAKGYLQETTNVAPHPTITQWPMQTDYTIKETTKVMIEAFETCLNGDIPHEPNIDLSAWVKIMDQDEQIKSLWADHAKESIIMDEYMEQIRKQTVGHA